MKIKREVNGQEYEFELTWREAQETFCEFQHECDREDVEMLIECMSDNDVMDVYGVSRDVFEGLVEDIAIRMRRNIDKYDNDLDYARDEAVRWVIDHMETER